MSEVYGEKPKILSREWWPYFWMYYKWHTIIVFAAVIILGGTIYQRATDTKYDLEVMYLTDRKTIESQKEQELAREIEELCQDSTGDGEVKVYVTQIILAGTTGQVGYDANLITKHDLEMGAETMYLCIYDTPNFERVKNRTGFSEAYLPIDKWYKGNSEDLLSDNGIAYGVSLKDSPILNECNISDKGLYVFVKNDTIDAHNNDIARQNAIEVANKLIK